MAKRKPEISETGDLAITTVETVTDYAAYAKLDKYNKKVYLAYQKTRLQKSTERIISNVTEAGGQGTFRREK